MKRQDYPSMLSSALARSLFVLLLLVLSISVLLSIRYFFASTQVAYAWGDGALLEMYTIHASRGLWELGPYSRFGWHHPGPLLFYLLLPVYALSGWHTFGLNAGALAINTVALLTIAWAAARWASPATGCAVLVAVAVYLFRVGEITISYWNPHVIVLPFGALVLLAAAVLAGRPSSLPAMMLVGSFLVQTHISLAPTVAVVALLSLVGLFMNRSGDRAVSGSDSSCGAGTWIAVSVVTLAVLWWPPLMQEVRSYPGNLSRLVLFFAEPDAGQPWSAAISAWGDLIAALFARDFRVPGGATIQFGGSVVPLVLAAVQLLLMIVAWRDALRRADRFQASLCLVGAVASVVALLSITRIRLVIEEYLVFWITILGALNWAALGAAGASRLRPALQALRSRVPGVMAAVVVVAVVLAEVEQFGRNVKQPLEEPARTVEVLAEAVQAYLKQTGAERPLVHVSSSVLSEGAGVVVRLYKLGVAVTVENAQAEYFGQPLASHGKEDSVISIADAATHAVLSRRPGDRVLTSRGAVYVHADTAFQRLGQAPSDTSTPSGQIMTRANKRYRLRPLRHAIALNPNSNLLSAGMFY